MKIYDSYLTCNIKVDLESKQSKATRNKNKKQNRKKPIQNTQRKQQQKTSNNKKDIGPSLILCKSVKTFFGI
jgi:hypothetical protein